MQDFKKRKLIFFLLLVLMLAGFSAICSPAYINLTDRVTGRNKCAAGIQSELSNSVDVLVLGDSLSTSGISPMELWKKQGISSYICGQSGQRATEAYYLLRQALKTQSPSLVILETNFFFRYEGIFSEIENGLSEMAYYYFPVLRYHNIWKSFTGKNSPPLNGYYKGFQIHGEINPYDSDDYMKKTEKSEKISGLVKYRLNQILKLCAERNIQVLLISNPSPLNHSYQKHNAIRKFADENHLPYIDFNLKGTGPDMDWTKDTMDNGDHLNYHGAVKISDYLASYLKEHYKLPDHRGERAYADWSKELGLYLREAEKKMSNGNG